MRHALCKSYVKAVNEDEGTVDKIVSVFGNVDLGGDRVVQGAFADTLDGWKASGDPIPVIFSHQWNDLDAHVGVVADAKELGPGDELLPDEIKDLGGLWVREKYDMDQPTANRLFQLQKQRRIKESSFAYDIPDGGQRKADDGANELVKLDLIEVGPTLKGMNPATQLLDVKSLIDAALKEQTAAGTKAQVSLDGSVEQRQSALADAVRSWAVTYRHDDIYLAAVEATFDDHVIAYVEAWEDPWGGGTYYEIPYTAGENGIELGDAVPVEIVGTVRPKAHLAAGMKRAVKEGRRNSNADSERIQSLHDITSELGAECASADGTASDDAGKSLPDMRHKSTLALFDLALAELDYEPA